MFGYEKLKKIKKEEKLIKSQKVSMDKFVINNKQNITQNLDENITNEQEIYQKELKDNEMIQLQDNNDDNVHDNNDEFEYKKLISQFTSQKARKIYFK